MHILCNIKQMLKVINLINVLQKKVFFKIKKINVMFKNVTKYFKQKHKL